MSDPKQHSQRMYRVHSSPESPVKAEVDRVLAHTYIRVPAKIPCSFRGSLVHRTARRGTPRPAPRFRLSLIAKDCSCLNSSSTLIRNEEHRDNGITEQARSSWGTLRRSMYLCYREKEGVNGVICMLPSRFRANTEHPSSCSLRNSR